MSRNAMRVALALALVAPLLWAAPALHAELKPTTKIVDTPGAPVKITSYSARYQRRLSYGTAEEGIHHSVKFDNTSGKTIEAVQISLVSFDLWNEFLDRTGGIDTSTLAPGKSGDGTWVARALSDFTFLTGVAYVSRVRFDDGTIWSVDEDAILAELRKIQTDFDAANLKKKSSTE